MMRSILALLTLAVPICAHAAPVPAPVAGLSMSARFSRSRFKAGDAVDVVVTLRNTSDKRINLGGSALENSAYSFDVRDERGARAPQTLEGERFFKMPFAVFANSLVSLESKQERIRSFRLSQLLDLSAGGRFSLHVSRGVGDFFWANARVVAPPVAFEIERAPAVQFDSVAPLATTGKFLVGAGSGDELTRLRVEENGALSPTRGTSPTVPRATALVVSPDGRFVYVVRDNTVGRTSFGGYAAQADGAIFPFRVGANGALEPLGAPVPLAPDFYTLILDATRGQLVSFSNYQHGRGLENGGRAWKIQPDGRLVAVPGFTLDETATLAFSPSGRLAFTANYPVSAFRVAPDGHFTRETYFGWRLSEGGARDVWVSPDGKLLLVQLEAESKHQNGATKWAQGGALFRIFPGKTGDALLQRVPGVFFDRDGRGPISVVPVGFDPSGRFVLGQTARGDIACFDVSNPAKVVLKSRFPAGQQPGWSSRGNLQLGLAFDEDGHTFYTAGGGVARAFRLSDDGDIQSLGAPISSSACSVALVAAPRSVAQSGILQARLTRDVATAGAAMPLEIRVASPTKLGIEVVRLRESWQKPNEARSEIIPILRAGQISYPLRLKQSARLDVSRLFDASRPGIYRVKLSVPGASPLELEWEVRDPLADAPFVPIIMGNSASSSAIGAGR